MCIEPYSRDGEPERAGRRPLGPVGERAGARRGRGRAWRPRCSRRWRPVAPPGRRCRSPARRTSPTPCCRSEPSSSSTRTDTGQVAISGLLGKLPALDQVVPQRAGAHREDDVVDLHPEGVLDRLGLVQREAGERDRAVRADRVVPRCARGGERDGAVRRARVPRPMRIRSAIRPMVRFDQPEGVPGAGAASTTPRR